MSSDTEKQWWTGHFILGWDRKRRDWYRRGWAGAGEEVVGQESKEVHTVHFTPYFRRGLHPNKGLSAQMPLKGGCHEF